MKIKLVKDLKGFNNQRLINNIERRGQKKE